MKLLSKWMLLFVSLFCRFFRRARRRLREAFAAQSSIPAAPRSPAPLSPPPKSKPDLQRKTTSDSDGTYVILALPVGHYRVEAEASGFQTLSRDRITLDVNQNANVSFRLVVGGESYKSR